MIKHLFYFVLSLVITSCSLFPRIHKERTYTERIDTLKIPIPRPQYTLREFAILTDTITINDPKLNITLIRHRRQPPINHQPSTISNPNTTDSLEVVAIIKPSIDTVTTTRTTITETRTDTIYKKETPWHTWILIGVLLALITLLLLKNKLTS